MNQRSVLGLGGLFRYAMTVGAMAPIASVAGCGATIATPGDSAVTGDASTDAQIDDAVIVTGRRAPDAGDTDAGSCAARVVNGNTCGTEAYLPCGIPASALDSSGNVTVEACQSFCASTFGSCGNPVHDEAGSGVTLNCYTCATGRRPEGFVEGTHTGNVLGRFFARVTELEAASVPAFETLALELELHGAPSSLVQRARDAADDERRHARATGALAQRFGATVEAPVVGTKALRTLEAMATDNVVEGCVRETFGALFASWQAAHAQDECVKRAMAPIAQDETRHADLSWAIAAWADGVMDAGARARVARARDEAVRALCESIASSAPPSALVERAGVPARESAVRMAGVLRSELWAHDAQTASAP